jgi:hypothetical protein
MSCIDEAPFGPRAVLDAQILRRGGRDIEAGFEPLRVPGLLGLPEHPIEVVLPERAGILPLGIARLTLIADLDPAVPGKRLAAFAKSGDFFCSFLRWPS